MKINEKLVAVAVATSMVVPTIMPIMATGDNATTVSGTTEATTGTTTATYEVSQSYQWTVPTNITFADDNGGTTQSGTVAVTKNVIPNNNTLKITVSGNGGGTGDNAASSDQFRVSNGNHYLNYTVSKDGSTTLNAGDSVLEVAAGTNTKEQSLTFTLDTAPLGTDTAKVSGTYTGKVIYTASVESNAD